ncbi:hypothetical protein TEQG_03329 [Trichophyton equinum CBS 127.97]|uniref:Uncharacterized protein n=1 Tax=Trichophyton equinum (strain ATCC MYA-4606 / CBS 127.97) TaxID=559882 RepID=F2PQY1_TRIEC|nr:hypothetical protein TEQG_03329 [Trichophyton equinum CBS 127.97]
MQEARHGDTSWAGKAADHVHIRGSGIGNTKTLLTIVNSHIGMSEMVCQRHPSKVDTIVQNMSSSKWLVEREQGVTQSLGPSAPKQSKISDCECPTELWF